MEPQHGLPQHSVTRDKVTKQNMYLSSQIISQDVTMKHLCRSCGAIPNFSRLALENPHIFDFLNERGGVFYLGEVKVRFATKS